MRALIILSFCICVSCGKRDAIPAPVQPMDKTQTAVYQAGDSIVLKFNADEVSIPPMLINSAIGSTTIPGKKIDNSWHYRWPAELTQHAGQSSWVLLKTKSIRPNGKILINPEDKRQSLIETYLGPKSIRVGGKDHAMLVALPTDIYDNLLTEGSPLTISTQIDNRVISDSAITKNGLVWTNLYGSEQSGLILSSVSYQDSQSKELSIKLWPQKATDFEISYEQAHPYADGHQLLTLSTSRITDSYGNTISDGTLVNFEITTSGGQTLYAMATSIAGVATTTFLHPERADHWKIGAYITGIAQSNSIALEFKSAFNDYGISVSENNREILIEPIKSFMDQLIPDGMGISWQITDETGNEKKVMGSTRLGQGQLILDSGLYPPGNYEVSVTIGGIKKQLNLNITDDPLE